MSPFRSLDRGVRLLLALAVGGALFGVAAAVQADIPDSGVIHGCYPKNAGTLRVIDTSTGTGCRSSEKALNWNQTGPTGARGATGPTGPRGTTGTKGVAGPKGSTGPRGPTGSNASTGARGPTGPAGTARAWAFVTSDGTVDHGVNVSSVTHFGTGVYCVHLNGISPNEIALVTAHGGSTDRWVANTAPGGCGDASGTGIEVSTWDTTTNANSDTSFYIAIP